MVARSLNLAVRFALELLSFALYASRFADSVVGKLVAGLAAAVVVALFWGLLIAPRARIRLPSIVRQLLALAVFAGAALCLHGLGEPGWAAALLAVAAVNAVLVFLWKQDRYVGPGPERAAPGVRPR